MPGYVYRGKQREGWPPLTVINQDILAARPPGHPGGIPPGIEWGSGDGTPCGTPAGRRAHYRRGEEPCAECRAAYSAYKRQHRVSRAAGRVRRPDSVGNMNPAGIEGSI